jgi:integrase
MPTISDLAEALVREYTINRRRSLRTLKHRWANHLQPIFASREPAKVSTDDIEHYIAQRLEEHAENSTINRELAALKRMYALGVRARKLQLAEVPYIPHLKERNVRIGFLRDNQYAALAEATSKVGLWLRTLFELGISYGMRKGELLSLRVSQVNLEEKTIILNAGETKNEEARLLPMAPKVAELVSELVKGKLPSDWVFIRNGKRIVDMRGAWKAATLAAGCPGLLFHDLRRTGVRNLIRSGVSEKTAMLISGHKTRAVFDRYHIVDRAELDDAIEKLEIFRRKQRQLDLFESGELFPQAAPPSLKKPN